MVQHPETKRSYNPFISTRKKIIKPWFYAQNSLYHINSGINIPKAWLISFCHAIILYSTSQMPYLTLLSTKGFRVKVLNVQTCRGKQTIAILRNDPGKQRSRLQMLECIWEDTAKIYWAGQITFSCGYISTCLKEKRLLKSNKGFSWKVWKSWPFSNMNWI